MKSMRKLIEQKLESARVDLERTLDKYEKLSHEYKTAKKNDTAVFDLGIEVNKLYGKSQQLIGCMQAYLDLLNLKELSEMESKAEKYDELKALHESDKAINDGLVKINKSLEQENKILKDGFKAIKSAMVFKENEHIGFYNALWFYGDEDYNKIKDIVEVIENE